MATIWAALNSVSVWAFWNTFTWGTLNTDGVTWASMANTIWNANMGAGATSYTPNAPVFPTTTWTAYTGTIDTN